MPFDHRVTRINEVPTAVRDVHEERVLGLLRRTGPLTRSEIASRLGISRTTISVTTSSLVERGAIVVADTDAEHREGSGRPAERLALDPRSGQLMGIDFGLQRVRIALADASHEIIASANARYAADDGWRTRLQIAFDAVDQMVVSSQTHLNALHAIAVGVPGPVTPVALEHIDGWGGGRSSAVREAVCARFTVPVIIDNNTRFAALAEAAASPGVSDVLYARVSEGVGGGVVIGGRLVGGAAGLAGEIGHVRAVFDGGRLCRCGKVGCLETLVALPAILAECAERGVLVESLDELKAQIFHRHPVVDEVLRQAGVALGRAIAAAAMVMDPGRIILGGAVVGVAPTFFRAAADTIAFELFSRVDGSPIVFPAQLGDDDGALGAVRALFDRSMLLADRTMFRPSLERFTIAKEGR